MMLVDTGASSSLISEQLWIDLGRPKLKMIDPNTTWTSASGDDLIILGEVKLEIKIGDKIIESVFVVVRELTQECIVGVDVIHHMEMTIDFPNKRLTFKNSHKSVPIDVMPKHKYTQVYQINLNTNAELEPITRSLLRGRLVDSVKDMKGTVGLVEGYDHEDFSVACSLNEVYDNNEVICEVFNKTEERLMIDKMLKVAKFSVIPEYRTVETPTVENFEKKLDHDESFHCDFNDVNVVTEHEDKDEFEVTFKDCSLNKVQKDQLTAELKVFKDVFVTSSKTPGRTPYLKFKIDTGDHKPIRNNPYRVSKTESDIMEKEIDQYLKLGLIRISQSPWSSPVLMIRKPDGGIRFCIDYRKLNSVTVKDSYPLPRIDDLLDVLGGAMYFSSMDIASGYWNVPMHEESIPKTAFACKFGLYEWLVMPFGLTNAPAAFQKLMDQVLINLKWKICLVYLDHCVIFSKTFREHLVHIHNVLNRFRDAGFKLKMNKCHWGRRSIPFLGHIVTNEGILPNPAKVVSVMKAKPPTDVSSLRSFTGLTSYFRRFIKDYAKVAAPLEDLKKKDKEWDWDQKCQDAFERLKILLCSPPMKSSFFIQMLV